MLRTAAHRLHRSPHVLLARDQVPTRGREVVGIDAAAHIDFLRHAFDAVGDGVPPHYVTIAGDDGVRAAEFVRLIGIERRVDAAEDYVSPALASHLAHFVPAQRIAGMDSDTDDVAGL